MASTLAAVSAVAICRFRGLLQTGRGVADCCGRVLRRRERQREVAGQAALDRTAPVEPREEFIDPRPSLGREEREILVAVRDLPILRGLFVL